MVRKTNFAKKFGTKTTLLLALAATLLCGSKASGSQVPDGNGRVQGVVVVKDSMGNSSSVPSVKVVLNGPSALEVTTDEHGRYVLVGVLPGSYVIHASTAGFETEQLISVEAGQAETIELELKAIEVKSSVTVTASEEDSKQPAPSASVDERTLRDAPNATDRFENALPLLPGVVRGPDGRINLKGGRATQSGALVNSANVTDPAKGGPAINVPIDVVSSVQVVSNPL